MLIDEFKNAVFNKVELEYQDNSALIELFPFLVNQKSKSDVRDKLLDFLGMNNLLQVKSYRLTR